MVDPANTKVIVVGAGLMGTGIAHAFASSGYPTTCVDVSAEQLAKMRKSVEGIVAGAVKLGKSTEEAAKATLARLITSESLTDSLPGTTLLVESASEKMPIKLEIVAEADRLMGPDAVIATNTSALSITEIAKATKRPERVIGMHYFNPVHKMKLVEIIKGLETSKEVVDRTYAWAKSLNKTVIVVNEWPGFATSRMSAMMGNEAMYMLSEGVSTAEDIDTAMRLAFNHPMGPLELGDLTGWDTRLAVIQHLHQTLGEKFRPCPLILKMVKAGRYGRKTGKGVYAYDEKGEKIPGSGLKVTI